MDFGHKPGIVINEEQDATLRSASHLLMNMANEYRRYADTDEARRCEACAKQIETRRKRCKVA